MPSQPRSDVESWELFATIEFGLAAYEPGV